MGHKTFDSAENELGTSVREVWTWRESRGRSKCTPFLQPFGGQTETLMSPAFLSTTCLSGGENSRQRWARATTERGRKCRTIETTGGALWC